jgi:hypothetical protein
MNSVGKARAGSDQVRNNSDQRHPDAVAATGYFVDGKRVWIQST